MNKIKIDLLRSILGTIGTNLVYAENAMTAIGLIESAAMSPKLNHGDYEITTMLNLMPTLQDAAIEKVLVELQDMKGMLNNAITTIKNIENDYIVVNDYKYIQERVNMRKDIIERGK